MISVKVLRFFCYSCKCGINNCNFAIYNDAEINSRESNEDEDDLADFFARYFLCPIPYLLMKGIETENEIVSCFVIIVAAIGGKYFRVEELKPDGTHKRYVDLNLKDPSISGTFQGAARRAEWNRLTHFRMTYKKGTWKK